MFRVLNVLPHTGYENGRSNLFIRYYNFFDKEKYHIDIATTYKEDSYLKSSYDNYIGIVPDTLDYDIIHYSDIDDWHYYRFRKSNAKLVASWHNDLTWEIMDNGSILQSYFPFSLKFHSLFPPDVLLPTTFTGETKAKDFVSCKVKAILNRVVNPKIKVAANFDQFTVGSVGKLSTVYGIDFIIKLATKLPSVSFKLLAFDIPEDPNGKKLIEQLPPNLTFFDGRQLSVDKFFCNISMFIFAGRFCALPLVLQEAAYHCLPIVSWDVGNCNILTPHHLIEKWNLDKFSQAITYLENLFKTSKSEYTRLGCDCRDLAHKYCDITISVFELQKVYWDLIHGH